MAKQFPIDIAFQKPTDRDRFLGRREFVASLGLGAIAGPAAFASKSTAAEAQELLQPPLVRTDVFPARKNPDYRVLSGLRQEVTARNAAGGHNNFYEFLPGTGGPVWKYVEDFEVDPWKIEIVGQCNNPMTLDLDDLFAFEHEERLYHFRCVERWAMNVPWSGFPLRRLIEKADPKSSAKFVRFVSAKIPKQMPGIRKSREYEWPYVEALRLDEAMHELAMVVTGVYGEPLLKQHGAPVRIIVPWKYGYKSPKSLVRVEFLSRKPKTFWQAQPHEYGFVSNVNPNIPHPRWSQEHSLWLETGEKFATPIFNGYEKYVGDLYPDEPRTPQRALRKGEIAR